jgi:predicted nucleotide-binding protein (sugar kinase/HSP70/actin superfamily)
VDELEALGAEVYMAPMEEWVHYVGVVGLRKALRKKKYLTALNSMMKQYVQHRVEHKYARIFEGFLEWAAEEPVERTFEYAAPYVPDTFEGETVLSVGKSVELALRGASGIVNAMPFGCMPGTIVSALMRAITRDHGVPCISIPYDGTESSTTRLQIEAFMDQARSRHEARMGARAGAR